MTTAYITHDDCMLHDPGDNHPECPGRLTAIHDALHSAHIYEFLRHHQAPLASENDILMAHSRKHLEFLADHSPSEGLYAIDPDTRLNSGTLRAAYRAAGAVVLGLDLIMRGEVDNAFCAVRPPGHHAGRNRAMGFCFLNNIAIGALKALEYPDVKKLAVLDFDAHFGNGTEEILGHESSVLICSTFQHPLFPGGEHQSGVRNSVNVPLAAGSGPEAFREAVTGHWVPALESFSPDLILVSAGFDAHFDDPLTDLCLTQADFLWVTESIMKLAAEHAHGRVLSVLEGGYDLPALGASAAAHIRALMGLA